MKEQVGHWKGCAPLIYPPFFSCQLPLKKPLQRRERGNHFKSNSYQDPQQRIIFVYIIYLTGAVRLIFSGGMAGVSLWVAIFPADVIKSRIQVLLLHVHDLDT